MPDPPVTARVSDLHKSAFWIWGVTAMIMREPLGAAVRRLAKDGLADPLAQLTALRTVVTLLILSRQFLGAGVFFERVYLRADSPAKFPHCSYPMDFITRLTEVLLAVAASTTVGSGTYVFGWISTFLVLTGAMLAADSVLLLIAVCAGFSTRREIAPGARFNALALLCTSTVAAAATAAGLALETREMLALGCAGAFTSIQLGTMIRGYGKS